MEKDEIEAAVLHAVEVSLEAQLKAVRRLRTGPREAKTARKEAGYAVHRANFASWGGFLDPGLLLQQPSVQKDLKLTEQQIKQVKLATEQVTPHYREGLAQMTFKEQQRQANLQHCRRNTRFSKRTHRCARKSRCAIALMLPSPPSAAST